MLSAQETWAELPSRTLSFDYQGRLADYFKLDAHDRIAKSDLEMVWLSGGEVILTQIPKYGGFPKNLRKDGGNLPVKFQWNLTVWVFLLVPAYVFKFKSRKWKEGEKAISMY